MLIEFPLFFLSPFQLHCYAVLPISYFSIFRCSLPCLISSLQHFANGFISLKLSQVHSQGLLYVPLNHLEFGSSDSLKINEGF